jgi:hypothetical protein
MKTKYLHCSYQGSYYIDCKILEARKCESKDATRLDRILRQEPKRLGEDGFVIRYQDLIDEEIVVKWVPKELVKRTKK